MRQLITAAVFCFLSQLSVLALAQQASIETRLDRTEISRGETVTLQIRVYGQQGGVQIDLEPLRSRFEIVTTRSASHLRSVNNRIESWTDYMLVLFPRELGEQQIPPLTVGNEVTQSFTITVAEPEATGLAAGSDVYLEAILSKDSVYVQEQLLFTIRLHYTIAGIRNPNFTEVEPANAVVQMLGAPHQYEQLVDGVRYGVYEKNYVIFPQRSGELVIPDIVFRGELTDGSSNFVFRNPNMRPVTAFAEGYRVEVRERPPAYSSDRTWLPAADIQIRETWDRDLTRLNPGDTVERTITVVANGLDGAALPPLGRPDIERMNVYPEQPVIERMVVDGNIVGTRIEKYTLVATESGDVVIPEVNLPWWDVNADQQRNAVIPASYIQVTPTGGIFPGDAVAADGTAVDPNASGTLIRNPSGDDLLSAARTPAWILNLMALLIVVILGAMWWLWRRRQNLLLASAVPPIVRTAAFEKEVAEGQEKHAFAEIESGIYKASPQQIRTQLIAWGRQYFADPGLYNLDDLAERLQQPELRSLCQTLQASLYGHDASAAFDKSQRSKLLTLLKAERGVRVQQDKTAHKARRYELPPLYKQ
ncbi:MAG: BatD family protein [Pseudohongiella sp.]|nr:BatD family protein [Pseudohongiella sp.]MDO9521531.1 BatD family protein [Pseudohongiella sp.]MDP2127723.1 BatD family protein [Pseudohongiella sp.]